MWSCASTHEPLTEERRSPVSCWSAELRQRSQNGGEKHQRFRRIFQRHVALGETLAHSIVSRPVCMKGQPTISVCLSAWWKTKSEIFWITQIESLNRFTTCSTRTEPEEDKFFYFIWTKNKNISVSLNFIEWEKTKKIVNKSPFWQANHVEAGQHQSASSQDDKKASRRLVCSFPVSLRQISCSSVTQASRQETRLRATSRSSKSSLLSNTAGYRCWGGSAASHRPGVSGLAGSFPLRSRQRDGKVKPRHERQGMRTKPKEGCWLAQSKSCKLELSFRKRTKSDWAQRL